MKKSLILSLLTLVSPVFAMENQAEFNEQEFLSSLRAPTRFGTNLAIIRLLIELDANYNIQPDPATLSALLVNVERSRALPSQITNSASVNDPNKETNTSILSAVQADEYFDEIAYCIICQDSINKKEINLSCGHNFMHYDCLAQWMKTKPEADCPICRKIIVKEDQ